MLFVVAFRVAGQGDDADSCPRGRVSLTLFAAGFNVVDRRVMSNSSTSLTAMV